MKLLDQIIASVTDTKEPTADILRRCLVLAYQLKNDALKAWVEKELNGYADTDTLPEYRIAQGTAKGLFLGGWGTSLQNQPIPAMIMKPEHRHFARDIKLFQPIAAYDGVDSDSTPSIMWPQDLVVIYQSKFYEGMALNRAWMEVPPSMMTGLVDTVRTRILTFALQINDELPKDGNGSVDVIPPAVVEKIVNIAIYGGTNVVGDVGQLNAQTVIAGDFESLEDALIAMGITEGAIAKLQDAMIEDAITVPAVEGKKSVGESTKAWIAKAAKKVGGAGLKVGGAVVEEAIKRAVFAYLGLGI